MISKKAIEHIAKLARLKMQDEELNNLSQQLSSILEHFNDIAKVDTTGVKPLLTPTEISMYLRADVVQRTNSVEKLMENAPEKSGHLFKVPPVV